MIIAYLFTSFLLALFFLRGLAAYDGPSPDYRCLNKFYLNPNVGYDQKMDLDFQFKMRRWLSGSWFRATWLFLLWLGIPLVFFQDGKMPFFAAFLFALPGGWALAVAWYNARKRIGIYPRRKRIERQASTLVNSSWNSRNISPKQDAPPKVRIRNPCPGLSRMGFMIGFVCVSGGVYYGGCRLFGVIPIDWAVPVWTSTHVYLIVAGMLLGLLIGLICFGLAMKIEVRNELISDFITTLWQFCCNGAMVWIMSLGIGMSVALGKDETKKHLLHQGVENTMLLVLGMGCLVGLAMGIIWFAAMITRLRFLGYFLLAAGVGMLAARWQYQQLNVEGRSWIGVGLVVPVVLVFMAAGMIDRDRRQRRLVQEQFPD